MCWSSVPSARAARARYVRAHRKSVQRWLDDLQVAGLVAHEPERDEHGRWWRTQIVLLAAPEPSAAELRVASGRARGWRARERARRRRQRRACALATIRRRASAPQRGTRRRVARGRAKALHEARRRRAVEEQLKGAGAREEAPRDLTHPFGAPPPSADVLATATRRTQEQAPETGVSAAVRPAPTPMARRAFAAETDARARAAEAGSRKAAQTPPEECSAEIGLLPSGDFDAVVVRRIAERHRQLADRAALRVGHVERRSQELILWPRGRTWPIGRLAEAWVAHRYRYPRRSRLRREQYFTSRHVRRDTMQQPRRNGRRGRPRRAPRRCQGSPEFPTCAHGDSPLGCVGNELVWADGSVAVAVARASERLSRVGRADLEWDRVVIGRCGPAGSVGGPGVAGVADRRIAFRGR